jgi:hypothetical protein
MLPEAYLSHLTKERLRIKIPSKKGDNAYFLSLKDQLSQFSKLPGIQRIEVNPTTGSILVLHTIDPTTLDLKTISQYTELNGLFRFNLPDPGQATIPKSFVETFGNLNRKIKGFTGGEIDIATLVFLGLLGIAMVQMKRGHVMMPALTAIWYAFSLLKEQPSKSRNSQERTKIKLEEVQDV